MIHIPIAFLYRPEYYAIIFRLTNDTPDGCLSRNDIEIPNYYINGTQDTVATEFKSTVILVNLSI